MTWAGESELQLYVFSAPNRNQSLPACMEDPKRLCDWRRQKLDVAKDGSAFFNPRLITWWMVFREAKQRVGQTKAAPTIRREEA